MTQDNRIWILMSRLLSKEATPSEIAELQRLLEQSPDKQYLFSLLHTWFDDVSLQTTATDPGLDERFRKVIGQAEPPAVKLSRHPKRLIYTTAAAAVMLFLIWGAYRLKPVSP